MSEKSILQAAIRTSAGVWFEVHGKIWPKDRTKGLTSPKSNYLQSLAQRVVDRMEAESLPIRIIGLKPRQKGSTTYFGALDYHRLRKKSVSACIIGGQYSQTTELRDMIRTYQQNDTFDWGNTGDVNTKAGAWTNGSKLKCETAGDPLAGIAGTYQVLHATEVARWARYGVANAGDVLANIMKCVPLLPETMVILESTAEGASGPFYERWISAIDAEDFLNGNVELQPGQMVRIFAPWFEFEDSAMRLTPEQKRSIEKTLDESEEFSGEKLLIERYGRMLADGTLRLGDTVTGFDQWEQLAWRRWAIREECKGDKIIFDRDYPHSWRDAFVKSGNLRFNANGLSVIRSRLNQRVAMPGVLEETKSRAVAFRPTERGESKVILYEKPMAGRRYIMGIDPMTGATQTGGVDPDYHGVHVLRVGFWDGAGKWNRPATVARIIRCRWDIDVLEHQVWQLARYYGASTGCKIAIEMNMDRGLTELLKKRCADLYQREVFNQNEFKTSKAFGYLTNEKTRETLIECLAKAIREFESPGNGIDIFDEETLEECENFIVKMNGRSEAAEGFKDDDVFALALALLLIDHATTYMPNRGGVGLPPDLAALEQEARPLGSAFS